MAEQEFLGARRLSRSAHAVTVGEKRAFYFGVCETCPRPVRWPAQPGDIQPKLTVSCYDCDSPVTVERMVATTTTLRCDGSCEGAWGKFCSCGCGGVNHGLAWSGSFRTLARQELPESALAKFRATRERAAQRRERRQAAERRNRQAEFEAFSTDHQELVERLLAEPCGPADRFPNDFLQAMQERLRREEVLSGYMVDAVERTLDRRRDAREREVVREAEKARRLEAGYEVPEGRLEVTGVVTWTETEYGDWGDRLVMTVDTGQYKVKGTVPRELAGGYRTTCDEDGKPVSGRRVEPVGEGEKVAFTATLTKSRNDPTFGYFKRPTKARFLEREPAPAGS